MMKFPKKIASAMGDWITWWLLDPGAGNKLC